jgi:hypothetical protein
LEEHRELVQVKELMELLTLELELVVEMPQLLEQRVVLVS